MDLPSIQTCLHLLPGKCLHLRYFTAIEGVGSCLRLHTINGQYVNSVNSQEQINCITYSSAPEGRSVNVIAGGLSSGCVRYLFFARDSKKFVFLEDSRTNVFLWNSGTFVFLEIPGHLCVVFYLPSPQMSYNLSQCALFASLNTYRWNERFGFSFELMNKYASYDGLLYCVVGYGAVGICRLSVISWSDPCPNQWSGQLAT